MARDAKVIIMTDERVKERLQEYADQLGMTLSGLGAYILVIGCTSRKRW